MPTKIIEPGTKLGRLTIIGIGKPYIQSNGYRLSASICRCDCGAVVTVRNSHLKTGNTASCGCLHKEVITTHGHAAPGNQSSEYRAWTAMRNRTSNTSSRDWDRYGGRGITMCKRWESFENFLADMGLKPHRNYSIDRINNDGNYCPENCRWATAEVQSNNRRTVKLLTHTGKTMNVSEWSEALGIGRHVIYDRLYLGWSTEDALTTPLATRRSHNGGRKHAKRAT